MIGDAPTVCSCNRFEICALQMFDKDDDNDNDNESYLTEAGALPQSQSSPCSTIPLPQSGVSS